MFRNSLVAAIFVLAITVFAPAQDVDEVKKENTPNPDMKGEHPITTLMREKKVTLRKELAGVHPRVYLTQEDIDKLKEKAKAHPELFATAL